MILSVDESLKTEMRNLAMMFHVVSHSIFENPDIDLMVDDLAASITKYYESGNDLCALDDIDYKTDYLNTREKIQCAFVAFSLDGAEARYRIADFPFVIKLLCEANRYLGASDIHHKLNKQKSKEMSEYASKRHEENRSMKNQGIQYYLENKSTFSSKDDAAEKISKQILPVKFSTARKWLRGI
jgi:hypothetical protein